MSLSLNEIEATAKKAARGAGYPWGLAEEAAKAVRWLCANDVDGCKALAGLLTVFDQAKLSEATPDITGPDWQARGDTSCALITGAALSDRAEELKHREISIGPLTEPALMLPFAAYAARQIEDTVSVAWPGGDAVTDGDRLTLNGEPASRTPRLTIRRGGSMAAPAPRRSRAEPDHDGWATLARFARRTHAPATEESRLKGAGAGTTDND